MLLSLAIRNFVIVDTLDLDFAPGFTVLTGETGAGKSILIDAVQLALGERADADVVREGASRAEISAEFQVPAAARAWLGANALEGDDDIALARRVVDASGRSKAFVNGTAVTLAQLRELGELLVDVHGQHAHQSLLKPAAQQQLLDEHGGLGPAARHVADLSSQWRRAIKARTDAEAMSGAAQLEQERLRWIVSELSELAPQADEWTNIGAEQQRLSHAASLLAGAQAAIDLLAESDDSTHARIAAIHSRLTPLAAFDPRLQPMLEAIDTARIQIDDAARELNHYVDRLEIDDARLADVDARISALHAASRKFRAAPEQLPELLVRAQEQLAALSAAADLDGLRASESRARDEFVAAARALSKQRQLAATQMSREVTRAIQDLAMSGGRFEVQLQPLAEDVPTAGGLEHVEFLVAGHRGTVPKPLAKVASGGELARISLAISVIAAAATPVATLIFDEVDAGIGGAIAEIVGRELRGLGTISQVLCVTHLAQVACQGHQQLRVSKLTDGRNTRIAVAALSGEARVEEIARMVGGVDITAKTRAHALEMLQQAASAVAPPAAVRGRRGARA